MGLTDLKDNVPPKYIVTIREICTTVKKAEVSLIDGLATRLFSSLQTGYILNGIGIKKQMKG